MTREFEGESPFKNNPKEILDTAMKQHFSVLAEAEEVAELAWGNNLISVSERLSNEIVEKLKVIDEITMSRPEFIVNRKQIFKGLSELEPRVSVYLVNPSKHGFITEDEVGFIEFTSCPQWDPKWIGDESVNNLRALTLKRGPDNQTTYILGSNVPRKLVNGGSFEAVEANEWGAITFILQSIRNQLNSENALSSFVPGG